MNKRRRKNSKNMSTKWASWKMIWFFQETSSKTWRRSLCRNTKKIWRNYLRNKKNSLKKKYNCRGKSKKIWTNKGKGQQNNRGSSSRNWWLSQIAWIISSVSRACRESFLMKMKISMFLKRMGWSSITSPWMQNWNNWKWNAWSWIRAMDICRQRRRTCFPGRFKKKL